MSQIALRFDQFIESRRECKCAEKDFILKGIPRIIHQIWLGPNALPKQYKIWSNSWIEKHKNWKYLLWTDENLEEFEWSSPVNRSLFELAQNFGERSDILRLEILYKYGGVYVDCDFECVQSLNCMDCECDVSFFSGLSNTGLLEVNNAIIGSKPKHKILPEIWSSIHLICKDDKSQNTLTRTGPIQITRSLMNLFAKHKDLLIFPNLIFYPFPNNMRLLPIVDRFRFYDNCTLAVHHWGCSWNQSLKKNKVNVNEHQQKVDNQKLNVIDSIMKTNDNISLQSKIMSFLQ